MHFSKEVRAISTLLFILITFVSLVVGGLIAYMWVMSSYYDMPQNSTLLSVESVVFPLDNFNYFNVTVLNPSNSGSDLNITGFQVIVESQNETFSVGTVDPSLPFQLTVGTKHVFKVLKNWSGLAGQSVRVEPLVDSRSVPSVPYVAPTVNLFVSDFGTLEDAQHFNLTVENSPNSAINLTVTEIRVFDVPVNATPSPPTPLPVGQQQEFRCAYDWSGLGGQELTIKVLTDVGFEQDFETSQLNSSYLNINAVHFSNASTEYFDITVSSQPGSLASATLTGVNVTLANNTTLALQTIPQLNTTLFPILVAANGTVSIRCIWDWSAHRNESIVVQAFTKEGYNVQDNATTTPAAVIWSVDNIQFDLTDLEHFTVNVTNAPASLGGINVTEVMFNQNASSMNPVVVEPGNSSVVVCGFNWTNFVGSSISVTVHGFYGQNETTISQVLVIPYLKVANASFSNFPSGNPYVNVTVFDSVQSPFPANITGISAKANSMQSPIPIDGTIAIPKIGSNGYQLSIGNEVTFVCPWDWSPYNGQDLTFAVQTTGGPTFSATFHVG